VVGGSLKSSAYPNKSGIKMSMSVELWWNDTDRETPKYLGRTYSPIKNLKGEVLFDFTQYFISRPYVTYVFLNSGVTCQRKGRRICSFNGHKQTEVIRKVSAAWARPGLQLAQRYKFGFQFPDFFVQGQLAVVSLSSLDSLHSARRVHL